MPTSDSRSSGSSPRNGSATGFAPTAASTPSRTRNKPTGMWDGYQGNVERIIANVARPCARGLARARSRRADPDGSPAAELADLLLLQMPAAVLRGLGHVAMPQRQPTRRRPGHGDVRHAGPQPSGVRSSRPDRQRSAITIDDFVPTLRNDGEFLEDPVTAPAHDPARQAAPRRVGDHAPRSQAAQRLRHLGAIGLSGMGSTTAADHRPGELLRCRNRAAGRTQWRHRRSQAEVRGAMNDKNDTFDLEVAHAAVALDVAGVLGAFLDGQFEPDRSIGDVDLAQRRQRVLRGSLEVRGPAHRRRSRASGTPTIDADAEHGLGLRSHAGREH